jgi:hypothetical protein
MDPFSGFGSGLRSESGSSLSDPDPNFSDLDPGFALQYYVPYHFFQLPRHPTTLSHLLKIFTGAQSIQNGPKGGFAI